MHICIYVYVSVCIHIYIYIYICICICNTYMYMSMYAAFSLLVDAGRPSDRRIARQEPGACGAEPKGIMAYGLRGLGCSECQGLSSLTDFGFPCLGREVYWVYRVYRATYGLGVCGVFSCVKGKISSLILPTLVRSVSRSTSTRVPAKFILGRMPHPPLDLQHALLLLLLAAASRDNNQLHR